MRAFVRYACICVFVHAWLYVCVCAFLHAWLLHTCVYAFVHACLHYACVCACVHACLRYTCVFVHVCVHYVCVYVCACMRAFVMCVCACVTSLCAWHWPTSAMTGTELVSFPGSLTALCPILPGAALALAVGLQIIITECLRVKHNKIIDVNFYS